jgi:hypothetical protein
MTRRTTIILTCVAAALAVLVRPDADAQGPPQPRPVVTKWEYKLANVNEKELNRLGDEGWEVVGTASQISSQSARGDTVSQISSRIQAILKRPK